MNEWNGLCVWFIYFFSFALWTLHFFHDNIIYCCGFSFTDSWKPHHVSRWFVIVYCFSMTRASVQTRLGGLLEFFLLCESNSYKFQNSNSTHGTWINPIMSSTLLLIHFAVVVFFSRLLRPQTKFRSLCLGKGFSFHFCSVRLVPLFPFITFSFPNSGLPFESLFFFFFRFTKSREKKI